MICWRLEGFILTVRLEVCFMGMKDVVCAFDFGFGLCFRVKSCKVGIDYLIFFLVIESNLDGEY